MELFNLITFVVLSLIPFSICEDVCVKKSPCVCQFPNGTGIDLTPAAKADFYSAETYDLKMNNTQWSLTTYYYNPCTDIKKIFNNVSGIVDTCTNNLLSICRHTYTFTKDFKANNSFVLDTGIYELIGSNALSDFSPDSRSIKYMHLPSDTTVHLICSESDNQFEVSSTEDPEHLQLSFYSRHSCLKLLEEPGRSFGSTLLIIFFSLVIFYLVLGVCTKKFLMGATGLEVIPNLGFWTDLPNLVKDGWAFTLNGFKLPARGAGPVTTPDPNSYDSI